MINHYVQEAMDIKISCYHLRIAELQMLSQVRKEPVQFLFGLSLGNRELIFQNDQGRDFLKWSPSLNKVGTIGENIGVPVVQQGNKPKEKCYAAENQKGNPQGFGNASFSGLRSGIAFLRQAFSGIGPLRRFRRRKIELRHFVAGIFLGFIKWLVCRRYRRRWRWRKKGIFRIKLEVARRTLNFMLEVFFGQVEFAFTLRARNYFAHDLSGLKISW